MYESTVRGKGRDGMQGAQRKTTIKHLRTDHPTFTETYQPSSRVTDMPDVQKFLRRRHTPRGFGTCTRRRDTRRTRESF
jgi:hypothetical protein